MADRYSIALNKIPEVIHIRPGICLTVEFYYQNILLRSEEVTINFGGPGGTQDIVVPKMDAMIDMIVCKFRDTIVHKKEFLPTRITSASNLFFRTPSYEEFRALWEQK